MIRRFLKWLGFLPEPIQMRGIYGVTPDGRYIVRTSDGRLVESHKLTP